MLAILLIVAVVVLVLYWLLITTEGTYLGPGLVAWTYDLVAKRYDRMKGIRYVNEVRFLGMPLVERLANVPQPRILDVATGTGRLPLLARQLLGDEATVVALDRSLGMLREASTVAGHEGVCVTWLRGDASALAFRSETFDAVCCLEALEFVSWPRVALEEMLRVLRPGGVLLISNRIGSDARFFPGRLCGRGKLEQRLTEAGAVSVTMERWQAHYDLVWARKAPSARPQSERQPQALAQQV